MLSCISSSVIRAWSIITHLALPIFLYYFAQPLFAFDISPEWVLKCLFPPKANVTYSNGNWLDCSSATKVAKSVILLWFVPFWNVLPDRCLILARLSFSGYVESVYLKIQPFVEHRLCSWVALKYLKVRPWPKVPLDVGTPLCLCVLKHFYPRAAICQKRFGQHVTKKQKNNWKTQTCYLVCIMLL